jgi:hypothetical protein
MSFTGTFVIRTTGILIITEVLVSVADPGSGPFFAHRMQHPESFPHSGYECIKLQS